MNFKPEHFLLTLEGHHRPSSSRRACPPGLYTGALHRGSGLIGVFDFQALSNVPPLRNYFLEEDNYKNIKRPPGDIMFLLVQRFGELMRKLWNPRNFKAHVSPHEMLQAVVLCSKKTFQITKQGEE